MWRGTDRGIQAREYGSRRCCANSALSVMSSREGLSSGIELTPAAGRLTRIETHVWGTRPPVLFDLPGNGGEPILLCMRGQRCEPRSSAWRSAPH